MTGIHVWDVHQPFWCFFIATDQEVSEVVAAYRKHAVNGFSPKELEFAKAVCCLKLICIVKVGYDRWPLTFSG